MSIAKILASLDGSEQDHVTLATAIRAARPFRAHVVAFFAHPDPANAISFIGAPLTAEALRAVIDGQAGLQRRAARAIAAVMEDACQREGAQIVPRPTTRGAETTVSFCEAVGYPPKIISMAASLCDLAVLRPSREAPRAFETAIETILVERRPVLVAPFPPASFETISVGWDGSQAAAHGLSAAIPYLEQAKAVELVCLQPPGQPDFKTDDVADYLRAHGVAFRERHLRLVGTALHRMLARFALDTRADLLVTGGFGHSRLRETFFGGVTNEFVRNPPLPVLLMH